MFESIVFPGRTDFSERRFTKANFHRATFAGRVYFRDATFKDRADFTNTIFNDRALFTAAEFQDGATFRSARFEKGANFQATQFKGQIDFHSCHFSGRTFFAPDHEAQDYIFSDTYEVDFRHVTIDPPDAVGFRQTDFKHCRLLYNDLRKVELTDIRWPPNGARRVVYDEELLRATVKKDRLQRAMPGERCTELCTRATGTCALCEARAEANLFLWGWTGAFRERPSKNVYPWEQVERLYRELKQNHEDRRDYTRAGDFHHGEREMQRLNPRTPRHLKVFLWLYWLVSGYGEWYLRPLLWAVGLWAFATVGYLLACLPAKEAGIPALALADPATWGHAVLYSLQVMLFFRPQDFVLYTVGAKIIYTLQSLLGPLFLGLFALAVRQRLKR